MVIIFIKDKRVCVCVGGGGGEGEGRGSKYIVEKPETNDPKPVFVWVYSPCFAQTVILSLKIMLLWIPLGMLLSVFIIYIFMLKCYWSSNIAAELYEGQH